MDLNMEVCGAKGVGSGEGYILPLQNMCSLRYSVTLNLQPCDTFYCLTRHQTTFYNIWIIHN